VKWTSRENSETLTVLKRSNPAQKMIKIRSLKSYKHCKNIMVNIFDDL